MAQGATRCWGSPSPRRRSLEQAIPYALDAGFDMLLLDGSAGLGTPWAELKGAPDLTILRDAVTILRAASTARRRSTSSTSAACARAPTRPR